VRSHTTTLDKVIHIHLYSIRPREHPGHEQQQGVSSCCEAQSLESQLSAAATYDEGLRGHNIPTWMDSLQLGQCHVLVWDTAVAAGAAGQSPMDLPQYGAVQIMKELVPRLIGPQVGGRQQGSTTHLQVAAVGVRVPLCKGDPHICVSAFRHGKGSWWGL